MPKANRRGIQKAARRALRGPLIEDVSWVADPEADGEGTLFSMWRTIPGGFKWLHYFPIYEEILAPRRSAPITLLEIGVLQGASLETWRRYLHPASVVVGIDINPTCSRFDRPEDGVHVRIGPQQDPEFLRLVVEEFGPFDVVIDDGSHLSSHQIATFAALFEEGLSPTASYLVEDLHTNYWGWGPEAGLSFVELAGYLVDVMHRHYREGTNESLFRFGGEDRRGEFVVPRLTTMIGSIKFFDSVVVVEKKSDRPVPTTLRL